MIGPYYNLMKYDHNVQKTFMVDIMMWWFWFHLWTWELFFI